MLKILLTNDDGYDAIGLQVLIKALKPIAKVMVVAPARNKSACGHSLTLERPLRLIGVDDDSYKVDDATPTDCIYLSLGNIFKNGYRPDLVISGINIGANMGEDITYSGTAGGAMEAVLHGIPAIAISQVCKDRCKDISNNWDFKLAINTIITLIEKIENGSFPLDERKFLNVNIPPINEELCKGFKITKAGYREYGNDSDRHLNPRGEEFYWIGLHPLLWKESSDKSCDFEAIKDNFVSISPIQLDMTSYNDIEKLENWLNK
ncbi:5'-nucleotidase SurE [Aliarcobacter thereius]|uniref:5'-nucleotidase SurE n=2 Tax=Aliarcobacter thereius TaxID=544718 RepID=A0A1C0B9X0_9BACT|nr:5'/3'-nucleotidase SurE [Aliarcobacter thereius]OCL88472.1 5'-nucleotidase SurE [Aliarcobacter thereius]OCL91962.1 5'-nucleotidase SurE [Aliarcobacter thereius]OCL94940.1 5'-nucleotidase SurE [Aliarcobacter thereius LMG 24486]OCM00388.1 5'-nucleotidase SurE [Aliarcobacter thereius]QBF15188.1 broad specificity 5'(3')-nucleotidase and polyphosphatase [Aliarcobacter thereius LMG 24486]